MSVLVEQKHRPPQSSFQLAWHRTPDAPSRLGQDGGEPPNPPVDGHVIDLHTAFGQELFDIAIGEPVAQHTASTITSRGNRKLINAERGEETGRTRQKRCTPSMPDDVFP